MSANHDQPNTSQERLAKNVDSAGTQGPTISVSRVSPFSLEVTGKNVAQIQDLKCSIPKNTPVNVAFLGNESHRHRILAAKTIRECGLEPVPIISARRIRSQEDLDDLLGTLVMEASPRRFIFVGGDPQTPSGSYPDALSLLGSGVLVRHRIRDVGIVGYPEGHPKIEDAELWRALSWKIAFLEDAGCSIEITTQFGFDADAIARWIDQHRAMDVGSVLLHIYPFGGIGPSVRWVDQYTNDREAGNWPHLHAS
jgi:methylenetetrahydrofolate reductase (NADPH)